MKPELISFKLCPFVQRLVILLNEKQVEFDVTYIDLADPPAWFKEISPQGKVPLLRVGDTVLFESAVIMEYLDETHPPSLHPSDPLQKALNRAWVEYASQLFFTQFRMTNSPDEAAFDKERTELKAGLSRLEAQVKGPFFNGEAFALIDAAYAPLFMRARLLEQWHPLGLLEGCGKLQAWADRLLARASVQGSVVDEFAELFRGHIGKGDGYGAKLFGA